MVLRDPVIPVAQRRALAMLYRLVEDGTRAGARQPACTNCPDAPSVQVATNPSPARRGKNCSGERQIGARRHWKGLHCAEPGVAQRTEATCRADEIALVDRPFAPRVQRVEAARFGGVQFERETQCADGAARGTVIEGFAGNNGAIVRAYNAKERIGVGPLESQCRVASRRSRESRHEGVRKVFHRAAPSRGRDSLFGSLAIDLERIVPTSRSAYDAVPYAKRFAEISCSGSETSQSRR